MSDSFFADVPGRIPYGGPDSTDPLAYAVYQPDRLVQGKRMADHLRIAVCLWHSFNWPGSDVFGVGTFDRPWLAAGADPEKAAQAKLDAAFEFIEKLGVPFFAFHDRDVAAEGSTYAETRANLDASVGRIEQHMARTGARLLWGTANLFGHPRYAAGAATNPDPEVFAYAAAQVKTMLDVTHRLGGANYVLWGGREGYETLLNTDLKKEEDQLARFLALVAEYKERIGFKGTLLIEPKPQEPTKHQYDYDAATVVGFLQRHGLAGQYRLNLEANHATLAGHSFQHEVATAIALGAFGSIDANRGDYQNGWDTDQFPNSVDELALALHAAASEREPRRPLPRAHRRHRHARQGAPRGGRHGRARDAHGTAGGALPGLVRRARVHDPRRLTLARRSREQGRRRQDRPTTAIRPAGAARGSGQPSRLGRR